MTSRREVEHLLHPEGVVGGLGRGQQPGLLGQERVDPVAGDHHLGPQLARPAVGAHPDDPAGGVAQQAGGDGRGDQRGRPASVALAASQRSKLRTAGWSSRCRGRRPTPADR